MANQCKGGQNVFCEVIYIIDPIGHFLYNYFKIFYIFLFFTFEYRFNSIFYFCYNILNMLV